MTLLLVLTRHPKAKKEKRAEKYSEMVPIFRFGGLLLFYYFKIKKKKSRNFCRKNNQLVLLMNPSRPPRCKSNAKISSDCNT